MPRTIEIGGPDTNNRSTTKNRIDALVKLAFLPRYERLRTRYEELLAQPGSPSVGALRQSMREQYLRCVGVPMELSHDFQADLECIAVTGDASVESIAEYYREIYRRNGSSSPGVSSDSIESDPTGDDNGFEEA